MFLSVHNYLRQALSRDPTGWHPLLAVYYLTYACDYRCPFCSDGAGTPYPALRSPILRAAEVLELLGRVRRHCDYLVLTGGEPLRHPDLARILDGLPSLRFDGVVLTTIGDELEPLLPLVNRAVHHLVISLNTLDEDRGDRWLGRGPGRHARILRSLEAAGRFPGRRYEVLISSVAMPENLDDLHRVYDLARERGFRFALAPQLLGVTPHPALRTSPAYRALVQRLIDDKRKGAAINGTLDYLDYMRDLRPFPCRPSTVLALSPRGEVFYPCLEKGQLAQSLLEEPDLHALRRAARARFGPEPKCGNQCHSACALSFALILQNPFSMVREATLLLRNKLRR